MCSKGRHDFCISDMAANVQLVQLVHLACPLLKLLRQILGVVCRCTAKVIVPLLTHFSCHTASHQVEVEHFQSADIHTHHALGNDLDACPLKVP